MLVNQAVKKVLDLQRKYLHIKKNSKKPEAEESKETTLLTKLIRINYTDKFLRSLIFLKYYDKSVMYLIQNLLNGDYALSMEDLLYIITYSLKFQKSQKASEDISVSNIIQTTLPKLEGILSRVNIS